MYFVVAYTCRALEYDLALDLGAARMTTVRLGGVAMRDNMFFLVLLSEHRCGKTCGISCVSLLLVKCNTWKVKYTHLSLHGRVYALLCLTWVCVGRWVGEM